MKRFLRLAIIALAAASLLLGWTITPAQAVAPGWRSAAGLGSAQLFVGQQKNDEGTIAYCSDYELLGPKYAGSYRENTPGVFIRSDGSALTEQENGALSYLLLRWGQTSDNETAAAVQLSVWALSSSGRGWGSPGMQEIIAKAKLAESTVALGRSFTEQSLRYAGPYRIEANLLSSTTVQVRVLGAAGEQVPGLAVRARAAGSLQLSEAEPTGDYNWTSDTTARVLALQRQGFEAGAVTVDVAAAPAASVNWLVPGSSKAQRLITTGVTTKIEGSARLAAAAAFQPVVATQTSAERLAAPGTLYDNLRVDTAGKTQWLTDPSTSQPVQLEVVSTLWGPFPERPSESTDVPAGAAAVGSVTTVVSGPGDYRTAALPVAQPGYYVWTERIDPATAIPETAKNVVKPWQSAFGTASETSLLVWTPVMSTKLSSHDVASGSSVTDRITLSGLPPTGLRNPAPLTLTMYGPLAQKPNQSAEIPEGSKVFQSRTVPAVDGATAEFGPLQEPGCYTVVASLDASAEMDALRSDFGEPSETVCVTAVPPATVPVAAVEELAVTGAAAGPPYALSAAFLLLGTGLACRALSRGRKSAGTR